MKKEERLARIIGQISDDMLKQAVDIDNKKKFNHLSMDNKIEWKKWTVIAACAVLIIGVGLISMKPSSPITDSRLPMLTIDTEGFFAGGMGFEGYMAYDISELKNENPWSGEAEINHLPVYKNILDYDENYQVADIAKMKAYLEEIAKKLDMDVDNLEITDDRPDEETKKIITEKLEGDVPEGYFDVTRVFMKDKGIKVEVNTSLIATVRFDPPVSLPDKYSFTDYASYEDIVSVADYLRNEYLALIDMENPKANVNGGDYNIYNQQSYSIDFFDESGGPIEQIINYNFNNITFGCDDDGKLFIARIYRPDLSHKIGDYPIITPKEAEQLLLKGNYITTVPEEFPGGEYIRKIELIYRTGGTEKVYLPYYRIYVEMPTMKRNIGLNTYGAFYVPAVKAEYIKNMPLWDGSFN